MIIRVYLHFKIIVNISKDLFCFMVFALQRYVKGYFVTIIILSNSYLGQLNSGASQVLVVGKDNSISIKTLDPSPSSSPQVVVQKWPPPIWDSEDQDQDLDEEDFDQGEAHWQHQELLKQEQDDGSPWHEKSWSQLPKQEMELRRPWN